jgi:hypothetical protein
MSRKTEAKTEAIELIEDALEALTSEAEAEDALELEVTSGAAPGRTPRVEPGPAPDAAVAVETYTTSDGVEVPLYDPPALDVEGRLLRGAAHRASNGVISVEG